MFRIVKRKPSEPKTSEKQGKESARSKSNKSSSRQTPTRVKISASIPRILQEGVAATSAWDPVKVTLFGNKAPILEATSSRTSIHQTDQNA